MMSSEEDTECFGLYGDKLLKKAKRTRQRVDAGEPRNSYSSIPNFSSRPSFLSGGLYGAIFNSQQSAASVELSPRQHFSGLFNDSAPNNQGAFNNFAPSKMLNELLGRQMKAADAASSVADINMIGSAMDSSSAVQQSESTPKQQPMLNGSVNNFETTMLSSTRNTTDESSNQQLVDNANMLRDILQGRKKEILALEQELRAVSGGGGGAESATCPNNNNNEIKCDSDQIESGSVVATTQVATPLNSPHHQNERVQQDTSEQEEESDEDAGNSDASESGTTNNKRGQSTQKQSEIIMENEENSDSYHSDLSRGSNTSLVHHIKEEDMMMDDNELNPNNNSQHSNKDSSKPASGESVEVKRARVENIVSSMRSSPSLPVQVNGCKKRKLYHPQQHESARYGGLILEDEEDEPPALKQKRVEKDVLKTQLRTMQEQLAEMQQKYVQLCNRMELESDCQDENTGDMSMELASASAIAAAAAQAEELLEKTSPTCTVGNASSSKDLVIFPTTPPASNNNNNNTSSSSTPGAGNTTPLNILQHNTSMQITNNKQHSIIPTNNPNNKLHQHAVAIHPTTIQQQHGGGVTLNGSLLHQHAAVQHHIHQSHTPLQNPAAAAAAAAAMYLGVGHKMFLEQQEAQRLQKEAEHSHVHPQMPPHHHHPQSGGPPQPQGHHHPCPPPPHHHHHPSSHQLAVAAATAAKNAEFSERFQFFRNAPPGAISGSDLEGLAEILKTEISASLTILIDSILARFIQQRRFMGKHQSDVAAEQLNKDLLLASQLLDRKSPRTKVIDRGPNNNNNNPSQSGGGGSSSSMQSAGHCGPGTSNNNNNNHSSSGNGLGCGSTGARVNGTVFPINLANSSNTNPIIDNLPPHLIRQTPISMASMFQPPKPPTTSNPANTTTTAAAAMPVMNGASNAVGGPASSALYSMGSLAGSNPFCHMNNTDSTPQPSPQQRGERPERAERELPEQNEALSLVVTTKKKRHKVTDTRITPRTVSRILSQDNCSVGPPPPGTPNSSGAITPGPGNVGSMMDPKYGSLVPSTSVSTSVHNSEPRGMMSSGSSVNECTSPRPYHPPPPPMLPVSLPTSVAIPNPGLHESQVFSPYSPFYGQHQSSSPPDRRDAESPISHPPTLLHPALLAAHANPDFGHMRSSTGGSQGHVDTGDRGLDCNSADSPFDGMQPALSFSNSRWLPFSAAGRLTSPVRDSGKKSIRDYLSLLKQESLGSLNEPYSATLTPMHLRKAKLMFFWVRYPSSAVLKMYFPDIKFNKNNTAQLVKWFSNFREFYYIQMEKYARQAITEGLKNAEDIHVTGDSEIYRVLNLHYNRNNHIEVWGPQVPSNFRYVIEQTLREFYKAIQTGKDTEQSWKKSIYKVISRLDDPVPEYFKSPNFLEQLE